MTSRDLILSVEEADDLTFESISERCIYLFMRFHADRKGIFRLAMTELAAILNVNRQTVLKHVETLMQKNLVRRMGHGRYIVYERPMLLRDIAKKYAAELKEGQVCQSDVISVRAWGEELDFGGSDPRVDELFELYSRMEKAGYLTFDEDTGQHIRTGKPV